MEKNIHLFSESASWETFSEFTDANGNVSSGKGESIIKVNGSVITNNSRANMGKKSIFNLYTIRKISNNRYFYRSENHDLGIQTGSFFIAGNTVYSDFIIEDSKLKGFEIIERKNNICNAWGALLNGPDLINTWTATMQKITNTENKLTIRKLTENDTIPYHLLYLADPSEKAVSNYLEKGSSYIGLLHDRIIGIYIIMPIHPFTIELVNLAVDESFQGMGFGKQLIKHAIGEAIKYKYEIMEVGTGNSSIGQLAFYQLCGFTMDVIDRDFFTRNYPEPIFENGIQCRHMIRLKMDLTL